MTVYTRDTQRDDTIRYLARRLLVEQGWPDSGNMDDYRQQATEIYDAGLWDMAFGSPIPEAILKFRSTSCIN